MLSDNFWIVVFKVKVIVRVQILRVFVWKISYILSVFMKLGTVVHDDDLEYCHAKRLQGFYGQGHITGSNKNKKPLS